MRCIECGKKTLGVREGTTVLAVCPSCDRCHHKPADHTAPQPHATKSALHPAA